MEVIVKKTIVSILIAFFSLTIFGQVVWNNPVDLSFSSNSFFQSASINSNRNVYAWKTSELDHYFVNAICTDSTQSVVWGNPPVHVALSLMPIQRVYLKRITDEEILIYWMENNNTLKAQKMNQNGQILWGPQGKTVSSSTCFKTMVNIVPGVNGDIFIAWAEISPNTLKYCHLNANGELTTPINTFSHEILSYKMALNNLQGITYYMVCNNPQQVKIIKTDSNCILNGNPIIKAGSEVALYPNLDFVCRNQTVITKYDSNGNYLWDIDSLGGSFVTILPNSDLYLLGGVPTGGGQPDMQYRDSQVFLRKYDTNGNYLYTGLGIHLWNNSYSSEGETTNTILNTIYYSGKLFLFYDHFESCMGMPTVDLWKLYVINPDHSTQDLIISSLCSPGSEFSNGSCFLYRINYSSDFTFTYIAQKYLSLRNLQQTPQQNVSVLVNGFNDLAVTTNNIIGDSLVICVNNSIYSLNTNRNLVLRVSPVPQHSTIQLGLNSTLFFYSLDETDATDIHNDVSIWSPNTPNTLSSHGVMGMGSDSIVIPLANKYAALIGHSLQLIDDNTLDIDNSVTPITLSSYDNEYIVNAGNNLILRHNSTYWYYYINENFTLPNYIPATGISVGQDNYNEVFDRIKAISIDNLCLTIWNADSQNGGGFVYGQIFNSATGQCLWDPSGVLIIPSGNNSLRGLYKWNEKLYIFTSTQNNNLIAHCFSIENNTLIQEWNSEGVLVCNNPLAICQMNDRFLISYNNNNDIYLKELSVYGSLSDSCLVNSSTYIPLDVKLYPSSDTKAYLSWTNEVNGHYAFHYQYIDTDLFVSSHDNFTIKSVLQLYPNYPNPFNPSTTISFDLPNDSRVELSIYNIKGQKVATLINENKLKGTHSVTWNGKDAKNKSVSSGIYFSNLKTASQIITQKMIMLK